MCLWYLSPKNPFINSKWVAYFCVISIICLIYHSLSAYQTGAVKVGPIYLGLTQDLSWGGSINLLTWHCFEKIVAKRYKQLWKLSHEVFPRLNYISVCGLSLLICVLFCWQKCMGLFVYQRRNLWFTFGESFNWLYF